jgi:hypothetical protein
MLFSTALYGFDCEKCDAHLQATYLSRLILMGASLVPGLLVAQGLRAVGTSRLLAMLASMVTLLGTYIVGAGIVPRLKVKSDRPGGPA